MQTRILIPNPMATLYYAAHVRIAQTRTQIRQQFFVPLPLYHPVFTIITCGPKSGSGIKNCSRQVPSQSPYRRYVEDDTRLLGDDEIVISADGGGVLL